MKEFVTRLKERKRNSLDIPKFKIVKLVKLKVSLTSFQELITPQI